MKEKHIFSGFELSCLTVNLIIYKSFTDIPRRFLEGAGASCFLSALISAGIAYLVIWFLPVIYRETKLSDIFSSSETKLPKGITSLFATSCAIYLILSASRAILGVSTFAGMSAYPLAPFAFIALYFGISAIISSLRGLDGIIRAHSIIVPFCIVMTLVLLIAIFREADVINLFPVFGNGVYKTLETAVFNVSYYFDFILLFLLFPYIKNDGYYVKTIRISGAVGILISLFIMLSLNLILPYPVSGEIKYPLYQIMKSVYFGRFFQRIDAFYLLSASLSGMAYISFSIFLSSYVLKKAFFLSANRPLVPAITILSLLLALMGQKDIFTLKSTILNITELITCLIIILVPFLKLSKRGNRE